MIPLRDRNPTRTVPVVTILLILINVAVYFLVQPRTGTDEVRVGETRVNVDASLGFSLEYAAVPCELTQGRPLGLQEIRATFQQGDDTSCDDDDPEPRLFPDKNVWLAALFSMFLHGGLLHLGGNMLFLWIFGNNIEDRLGPVRYLLFYLAAGVIATGAHVLVQPDSTIPVVGASGAIAGVMGAYLIWFPNAPILTVFFFILILVREIAAKWLLAFWFVLQFFTSPNAGVAWVAHVGGFVFGVAVALLMKAGGGGRPALGDPDGAGGGGPSWETFGNDRSPWS